jgi:hypothetical protein
MCTDELRNKIAQVFLIDKLTQLSYPINVETLLVNSKKMREGCWDSK